MGKKLSLHSHAGLGRSLIRSADKLVQPRPALVNLLHPKMAPIEHRQYRIAVLIPHDGIVRRAQLPAGKML